VNLTIIAQHRIRITLVISGDDDELDSSVSG
jgi:hypothetical protein